MELMKNINKLADDFIPSIEEETNSNTASMLRSMTPLADTTELDKQEIEKRTTIVDRMKQTRADNNWI